MISNKIYSYIFRRHVVISFTNVDIATMKMKIITLTERLWTNWFARSVTHAKKYKKNVNIVEHSSERWVWCDSLDSISNLKYSIFQYTCLKCNLFDDTDKKQYHCDECGICRIGGRQNFFHCAVCNMCLPIQLQIDGHRCVENISRSNCPVCLGAIHTSRIPCHIPDCGHLLHKMCFDQLVNSITHNIILI